MGTVNRLTRVESWVCSYSGAVAAGCVLSPSIPDAFVGAYLILFLCVAVSIDVTLCILLVILKNEGNWWGW